MKGETLKMTEKGGREGQERKLKVGARYFKLRNMGDADWNELFMRCEHVQTLEVRPHSIT
jgi:hypothetical protein